MVQEVKRSLFRDTRRARGEFNSSLCFFMGLLPGRYVVCISGVFHLCRVSQPECASQQTDAHQNVEVMPNPDLGQDWALLQHSGEHRSADWRILADLLGKDGRRH